MTMNQNSCAFTGHRPKSFPWKYNEAAPECVLLKDVLTAQIMKLADRGVTEFLSGMALGVDLWSAQIVLGLQEKYPAIRLHCILPCEGQEAKWPAAAQEQYYAILKQASNVVYVSRKYTSNCMLERNHYLVNHASILLAVYNGTQRSGTGATVRYAQKQGREIFIIAPVSRTITHLPNEIRNKLQEGRGQSMTGHCPYCGNAILSKHSNFCFECGRQLREIPPEDAAVIAPEEERHKPMPVREKVVFIQSGIVGQHSE